MRWGGALATSESEAKKGVSSIQAGHLIGASVHQQLKLRPAHMHEVVVRLLLGILQSPVAATVCTDGSPAGVPAAGAGDQLPGHCSW